MRKRIKRTATAGLIAVLAVAPVPASAQSPEPYPSKPVRLTVASGAGGGLDFVARLVAVPLGEGLKQTVVVDNRAGASGSIAAEIASLAPPDGYTLVLLSASLVVYGLVNKTPLRSVRRLRPDIAGRRGSYISRLPRPAGQTVKELIAYAKANPGKLNYASTGNASLAHLAGEFFAHQTGMKLVHIPYKGVGAGLTDMLTGQVQMSFLSGGSVYARSGRRS